jgi:hypothetical protein
VGKIARSSLATREAAYAILPTLSAAAIHDGVGKIAAGDCACGDATGREFAHPTHVISADIAHPTLTHRRLATYLFQ